MIPSSVRFYNPQGGDRVAVVSVQPAWAQAETYLIQLARGPNSSKLGKGTVYGPYPSEQVTERLADVTTALKAEGFLPAGLHALLSALEHDNSAVRGRAAARLGWLRSTDAVEALSAALAKAVDDVCPVIDALGAIGDPCAIPVLRPQATRKLLSRRRSAVEALRNLGDAKGLAEARKPALDRLPDKVRQTLEAVDENTTAGQAAQKLVEAVASLDVKEQGLAWDTLYELATPAPVAAVRQLLRGIPFGQAHCWRYVKSVLKRSMLRHDYVTLGELMHTVEVQGRTSKGTTAQVKSGYDGVQRETPIFSRKTQCYVRRSAWRYLRMLAAHRPEAYAHAAAEALIHYTPEDAQDPQGLTGQFASCYLLHRILWGSSNRFTLSSRTLTFRFRSPKTIKTPPDIREEAFPHLWDAQPRSYLRVLGAARLPEAHAFAVRAIQKDHRGVLEAASLAEILPLLQAPYEPTVQLGLAELARRFDPQQPDWSLLSQLLADERPMAREVGQRWLRLTTSLWTRDPERIAAFLTVPDAATRALAAELTVTHLGPDQSLRQTLAERLLAILRAPEATEGAHEGCARVAREVLAEELGSLLTVPELIALVSGGSPSAQAVAGELLGHRPEAVTELGLERITALAQHQIAAVRSAAQALIRLAEASFRSDPSLLFVLVESEWPDTRTVAFELLRTKIDPATLGLDGLMGLLDSNRVDVQNVGQELVQKHFAELDAKELVFRLVQHPHPNMRRFALDLAVHHLPEGAGPLANLTGFFRAALFDLWPERRVKHDVIDFLTARGLRDKQQAEVAAGILGDVVRVQGRADFERALEGLVRLKLAYPQVQAGVSLQPGGVA
jgi:hypothetical protein